MKRLRLKVYVNDDKREAISLTPGFSPVTTPVKIKEPFKRFQLRAENDNRAEAWY